jgi:hypothetical protein
MGVRRGSRPQGAKVARPAAYAMVSAELIESGLDDVCFRLYAHFDRVQGASGSPACGAEKVGQAVGLQARTVIDHAKHLQDYGLIEISKLGQKKYVFNVVHNLSRGRVNSCRQIPELRIRQKMRSSHARYIARNTRDRPRAERAHSSTYRDAGDAGQSRSTRYGRRYRVLPEGSKTEIQDAIRSFPQCDRCGKPHEGAASLGYQGSFCDCPF